MKDEKGTPGDEDDWDIVFPLQHINWLADIIANIGLKPSIKDILDTEEIYPGLMTDISIVLWQRNLIRDQIKANNG